MNSRTQQKRYPVISVKVKDQNLEFDQISYKLAKIAADAVLGQLNFGEAEDGERMERYAWVHLQRPNLILED
ncbi:hypothetical protein ACE6H2_012427 [Prunus campanulata]